MFAAIESRLHRLRRRLSRNEWAIRHLGLKPSEGTSEEPGLLLIQIDGLSRQQFERALERGRMPFLQRLRRREGYRLHTFYPGLPTTTPAVQAELYYGVKSIVPAFSFLDRTKGEVGMMFNSDWAKTFEDVCRAQGQPGLLEGGSSWSNIYTGGAGQAESHFCAASIGFGDMWRTGKIRNIFIFVLLQLPASLRIAWQMILKTGPAVWGAATGILRGEKIGPELVMALSRIFIGTGLRELVAIGAKVDLARGLPIVHLNLLAYDEQAHRRGPGSRFAHWSLRSIDRTIRGLWRAAARSPRRDYAVWIFSDHGQEATRPPAFASAGDVEELVNRCLERARRRDPAWRAPDSRPFFPLWFSRHRKLARLSINTGTRPTAQEKDGVTVAAVGPVGHVYFAAPLDEAQRLALARRLVREGVPGVLVRPDDRRILWLHAQGETAVPDDVARLLPHPPALREEIAQDLAAFCANPHAGDLILLGWSPGRPSCSFAPERGAHGGAGPEETQGFVLLPRRTRLPAGTADFIRPAALRAAALNRLGRAPLTAAAAAPVEARLTFRVMTYNVHGCSGMDGRVSPRRIAGVIDAEAPDLIALQEVDLGRRRSRAEDQAALIARELGLHAVFCPTVTVGEEHYGHALLSRWPIEMVKRSLLPTALGNWWPEPRAALWARVLLGSQPVHVITTHLGLDRRERHLQMQALLGEEWLGAVPENEPAILCGDFNLRPGGAPYRLAVARLRDVQTAVHNPRPASTFSSLQPFVRIDHILISAGLTPLAAFVPRNELTRVASDHLPLVADLEVASAESGKPTRTAA